MLSEIKRYYYYYYYHNSRLGDLRITCLVLITFFDKISPFLDTFNNNNYNNNNNKTIYSYKKEKADRKPQIT